MARGVHGTRRGSCCRDPPHFLVLDPRNRMGRGQQTASAPSPHGFTMGQVVMAPSGQGRVTGSPARGEGACPHRQCGSCRTVMKSPGPVPGRSDDGVDGTCRVLTAPPWLHHGPNCHAPSGLRRTRNPPVPQPRMPADNGLREGSGGTPRSTKGRRVTHAAPCIVSRNRCNRDTHGNRRGWAPGSVPLVSLTLPGFPGRNRRACRHPRPATRCVRTWPRPAQGRRAAGRTHPAPAA